MLFQNPERFSTIEITEAGRDALKTRQKITLTKPVQPNEPQKQRAGEIACDEALFEKLRALRKQLADERGLPSYIIFSDVALRQMARFYPKSDREFSHISGVGDKKLREFGAVFLGEIGAHIQTHARQMFADDSFTEPAATPAPNHSRLNDTMRETLLLFRAGKTILEITRIRGLRDSTLFGHLEEAILAGENIDLNSILGVAEQRDIAAAFQKHGFGNLGGVVESLGGKNTYGECRLVRAAMQKERL